MSDTKLRYSIGAVVFIYYLILNHSEKTNKKCEIEPEFGSTPLFSHYTKEFSDQV